MSVQDLQYPSEARLVACGPATRSPARRVDDRKVFLGEASVVCRQPHKKIVQANAQSSACAERAKSQAALRQCNTEHIIT
jgi:hypothetical protein